MCQLCGWFFAIIQNLLIDKLEQVLHLAFLTKFLRIYLILHIFYMKGDSGALADAFNRKVKPRSVLILRMIRTEPQIELHYWSLTALFDTSSAFAKLPESKSEETVTVPKRNTLWEGGCGGWQLFFIRCKIKFILFYYR